LLLFLSGHLRFHFPLLFCCCSAHFAPVTVEAAWHCFSHLVRLHFVVFLEWMADQDFVLNESSTTLRSSIIESVLFAYCIIGILGIRQQCITSIVFGLPLPRIAFCPTGVLFCCFPKF
jgi:hypothetical protein